VYGTEETNIVSIRSKKGLISQKAIVLSDTRESVASIAKRLGVSKHELKRIQNIIKANK
jgi:hypothetical protein